MYTHIIIIWCRSGYQLPSQCGCYFEMPLFDMWLGEKKYEFYFCVRVHTLLCLGLHIGVLVYLEMSFV